MKRLVIVGAMLTILWSSSSAPASSLVLAPAANGFIWDGDFDLGLGLQTAPMDGVPDGYWDQNALKPFLIAERIQATQFVGPHEVRSALEFDLLPSIPVGTTIQSATLRLASHSAGSPIAQAIVVLGYSAPDLQIELADYDRSATFIGNADLQMDSLYSTQTDVTEFVRTAVLTDVNPGFRLEVSPLWASLSQVFSSTRNYSEVNPAPYLEVTFATVPEPDSLTSLASGALLGVIAWLSSHVRRCFLMSSPTNRPAP